MLNFRNSPSDFTRERSLTIEHTVGLIMSMALARNGSGYDISSQNYFRELAAEIDLDIAPVRHQSVSEARAKLQWQGFEYLLEVANIERDGLSKEFKFKGHITRAIDGTSFFTPRSNELLEHFSCRNTRSAEGTTHYPYGLCVTAINVFTGQPTAAVIDDYKSSERKLLKQIMGKFKRGDLSLLDRGLGGQTVYLEFQSSGQFFIHRAKTTGDRVAGYIQEFLNSKKDQQIKKISIKDEDTNEEFQMQLRLILGPPDSEGKPIVFVTNLLSKKKYKRSQIQELYQKRWSVETLYNRVKNLLCLEKFHAKTYNGIMQEIFSNLLVLSLTAAATAAVIKTEKLDPEITLPNFKNATEVVRRNLFNIVDHKIRGKRPKAITRQILKEVADVLYPIRPGRSFPRVSMQPIKKWNLKKSAKIQEFQMSNLS